MVTAADVAAYCQNHTTLEAATHFKVSTGYIRRLKREASRENDDMTFHGHPDEEIAGDNTNWTCPYTAEVLPIIPGTKKADWLAERKALHDRLLLMSLLAEQEAELQAEQKDIREPENGAEQAELNAEQAELNGDCLEISEVQSEAEQPEPTPANQVITVKRYVVYRKGLIFLLLDWWQEHGPPMQFTLGVVVGLFLIMVCW